VTWGDARTIHDKTKPKPETKDLAAAMPDRAKELQAKWGVWNTANVPPLWGGSATDSDGDEPGAPARRRNNARASP